MLLHLLACCRPPDCQCLILTACACCGLHKPSRASCCKVRHGRVWTVQDYLNIELDSHRNQLIQLELLLTAGMFAMAIVTLVAGLFGMNLNNKHEESYSAFVIVSGSICSGSHLLNRGCSAACIDVSFPGLHQVSILTCHACAQQGFDALAVLRAGDGGVLRGGGAGLHRYHPVLQVRLA
jgi:hypothetical protein